MATGSLAGAAPRVTTPTVRLDRVSLSYFTPERQTLALSSISFEVERGEFVAIVGQSGCGKTRSCR